MPATLLRLVRIGPWSRLLVLQLLLLLRMLLFQFLGLLLMTLLHLLLFLLVRILLRSLLILFLLLLEDGNQILFNGKKLIGTDARGCVNDLCAPTPLRLDIHCG